MSLSSDDAPPVPDGNDGHVPVTPKHPGVRSALGIVALYFLLQLGLGILVAMVIALVLGIEGGFKATAAHHEFDPHSITRAMLTNPDLRVWLAVITIAVAAVVMVIVIRLIWPAQWSRAELPGFGFVQPRRKLAYLGAMGLGLVVLVIGGKLTQLFAGSQPVHQDVTVMAHHVSTGMRILLAVLVVCVAPFVEELVFRGVLLSGLASRMRAGWAILASAIIFGCVHLPDFGFAWYPVPALILMGLVLAWMRVRTRSLWPSVTLHATNNFLAMIPWFIVASTH